jgi:peptidoglycan-associated lipoprotein
MAEHRGGSKTWGVAEDDVNGSGRGLRLLVFRAIPSETASFNSTNHNKERTMKKVIVGLMLTTLLAACASQKPKETPAAEQAQPAATSTEAPASAPAQAAVNPLDDPNSILAKRSTYYPFDVSTVQRDDRALVEAHAAYLKDHPDQKVRLEGNCDERGSAEYNLGLGQRRADGVKKMFIAGGVHGSQITTVSYGKERPKATCHEESCWKQNRRTDIVYQR